MISISFSKQCSDLKIKLTVKKTGILAFEPSGALREVYQDESSLKASLVSKYLEVDPCVKLYLVFHQAHKDLLCGTYLGDGADPLTMMGRAQVLDA